MNEAVTSRPGFARRHPVWTSLLALLGLLVAALALLDWNLVKGPVQRMVSAATGREFRIDGNLDVHYFPLQVHAERLYLANAAWSDEPVMARAEKVDMRVRFWPLLIGRAVLDDLSVEQPRLRIERNAEGVGNWVFGAKPDSCRGERCPSRLRILQLLAHDGRLEFREPMLMTSLDVDFDSERPARPNALAPLELHGEGRYRGAPFGLSGRVDSPLALQNQARRYSIDLAAVAGDTHARAYGTLVEPLQTENVAVNFELGGADLAHLYELLGIVLPATPPYQLKGRLTRNGARIGYHDFAGQVGDSDLAGDAEVDISGTRPKLSAQLRSQRIDFDDLAGFIGGTPDTKETASGEQQQEKRALRAKGKVLPDRPIHAERLRTMDADVRFTAVRVNSPRLPLQNMTAHLTLDNGRLLVDPLNFGAADGRLAGTVLLDARQSPAEFGAIIKVEKLQLPKLMPKVKVLQDSTGSIAGAIDLRGRGDSAAAILAHARGDLSVIMGPGRISNLLLEVAGLDVAESLVFLLGKDKEVRLRCAYAVFDVTDGVATARAVALDTTDTALLLRGDLSFAKESLDFTLLPRPKDFSPISIRTPIRIGGTFADPSVAPKGERLVLRGAAVAALASIAPPLALLGLIETGPGHDTSCGGEPVDQQDKDRDEKKNAAPPLAPKSRQLSPSLSAR